MTLNGAIMQLVEMRENSMMPEVFKPYLDKVIETVSECEEPPAQPEQRWIPIEEKGPGPNEIVLISVNGEVDVDWIDVDSTGYGCWYRCMKDVIDIDAWMPLPEPYKPPTRSQYRRMQEQKGEQDV